MKSLPDRCVQEGVIGVAGRSWLPDAGCQAEIDSFLTRNAGKRLLVIYEVIEQTDESERPVPGSFAEVVFASWTTPAPDDDEPAKGDEVMP